VREAGLFGLFGAQVNATDGRYVYMRGPAGPKNQPLFEYTHMPTHMKHTFSVREMRTAEMARPFAFTKGCPVMRINAGWGRGDGSPVFRTWLYDVEDDPAQQRPLDDPKIEKMMIGHMVRLMKANDAPKEQYKRLGLKA